MISFPSKRALVPMIIACALFMDNLDSTVIATSLPQIARDLRENPVHLSLAITSYLTSLAVFIPISGWVADRFGARLVFRLAMAIFMIGSVLCGFSQSLEQLIASRLVQGLGGAMMVPVGRLVILRSVPKSELVGSLAYLTVPALMAPVFGPPIGGFITEYFSWRWIFWINIPIGIMGILLATLFIVDTREPDPPPLDLRGFALTAIGLASFVTGFEMIGRGVLPSLAVAGLIGFGCAMLALYVYHARFTAYPVLSIALFRVASFRVSVLGGSLFRTGIGAIPFLLPLMLQASFGLSPFDSGLLTCASAVGALSMKAVAQPILRRFGFRRVLIANCIISALFLAAFGLFRADSPSLVIWSVLLLGGFFRSLQFTSVNALAYADIPREQMSQATSFASMGQQLSLSIGVGIGAMVLHFVVGDHHAGPIATEAFTMAFLAVAVVSGSSVFLFLTLPRDAGTEMSGHGHRGKAGKPPPSD